MKKQPITDQDFICAEEVAEHWTAGVDELRDYIVALKSRLDQRDQRIEELEKRLDDALYDGSKPFTF